MTYTPRKGATVYGIAGHSNHLIILCSDPIFWPRSACKAVLSVNISTWRDGANSSDPACILNVGDHPFIKHKSFVYYEQSVPLRFSGLQQRVQNGELIPYDDLTEDVLEKVMQGFYKSNRTPKQVLKFLKLASIEQP